MMTREGTVHAAFPIIRSRTEVPAGWRALNNLGRIPGCGTYQENDGFVGEILASVHISVDDCVELLSKSGTTSIFFYSQRIHYEVLKRCLEKRHTSPKRPRDKMYERRYSELSGKLRAAFPQFETE